MKRISIVFLLLTAASFLSFAEGVGIDAGVRVDLSSVNLEDRQPLVTPGIEYTNSFGDIDVYGDAEYTIAIGDEIGQEFYLEEEVGYNLSLGGTSSLAFVVNNTNIIFIAPERDSQFVNSLIGTLDPNITFVQGLDVADFSTTLGFPLDYAQEVKDADIAAGAYVTLGLAAGFGLGAELTLNYALAPDAEYGETELLLSYEADSFYIELDVVAAQEFSAFTITPEFEYYLNQFTLYAGLEADNVAGSEEGIILSPFLGAKCSF
jgi:hypothetical protein